MPQFFTPDPARRVAALEAKVAELERLVRSNAKHSHNMRDLKDGNLFDAAHGQVPKYDETLGQYRPGSAAGNYAMFFATETVAVGANVSVDSWSETLNEVDATISGAIIKLPEGLYMAEAHFYGDNVGGGSRGCYLAAVDPAGSTMVGHIAYTDAAATTSHTGDGNRFPSGPVGARLEEQGGFVVNVSNDGGTDSDFVNVSLLILQLG